MKSDYDSYKIECFEIGRGLWHARIWRADLKPVILDGVPLSALEIGFAWSNADAAMADARTQIDKFKRHAGARQLPQAATSH